MKNLTHKISEYDRFMALSDAEKDAQVARFDAPLPGGPDGLVGEPLSAEHRALMRLARAKARAKAGRPKVGEGAKIVPVSIERGLLRETDAFARRHKLKRSQMVADGLRLVMRTVPERKYRVSA